MAMRARQAGDRFLLEIISTVASSLDLDEVLANVVRLLSEAAAVHACFVYLIEEGGDRLVLKAVSEPYADLVDRVALERGEGLAWWAVEHGEPTAIRENALADPRVKYVAELDEELFQSLVAVPILARAGEPIGAILLHTEAPREFTNAEVDVLVSSATLVAGAIENARLYDETRRRLHELEQLIELGDTIARAERRPELLGAVAAATRRLLGAGAAHLYLLDLASEELRLVSSSPAAHEARAAIPLAALGPELAQSGRSATVSVPLVASDELLGLLVGEGTREVDLARAVANQAAVALKKIDLIERLTEKNLIKDFFEELAGGRPLGDLEGRAARLGFDPKGSYLVLAATPPDDELERRIAAKAPGSLFDRREDRGRALVRVPPAGEAALVEAIRAVAEAGETAVGISNVCRGVASFPAGFEEAEHALLGTTVLGQEPGVMTYDELGPYKYLLRMTLEPGARDSHRDAVARLAEYDRQRGTSLLRTLEEFLRRRGNVSSTAEALYVHPNTLRQRLRRIHELTGIDLRRDDWLMVEIAVKLVRLQAALGTAAGDTPGAPRV
ncbi:MAG: GAF domain-containing protein [Thermoleophilia bacterium]|nr:GAF domain-containing protein [Thermoleophilia bacterium]